MLTLTATVLNVFATAKFTDDETGEITPPGHKAQLQYEEMTKGSDKRIILSDFNVREHGDVYRKALGKLVRVPVGFYVDERSKKPMLYIPKGVLPTVAA